MNSVSSFERTFRCILLCFVIFYSNFFQGAAQDFGRFRPGINWQQVNTPVIRVIFPKGLEAQANRVANNILYLDQNSRSSIGPLSKKLDLILNNQGIISNGYVTLMPFRSEFYTTPMQDGFALGTSPWLDLLSVHEYRHALQYINMRRGYTKLAWWLSGEAGWGSLINLTTPGWFFEGDAVAMETALTNQGRGRLPSFYQQYRSILLKDRTFSYMKARNGSFRDIVPNDYELGYLLCSYGREKFGNDLWSNVIRRTAWLPGIIYPFSNALRAYTGMGTRKFYKKALIDYKIGWIADDAQKHLTGVKQLSAPDKAVTEYRFPVYQSNGDVLVYKESYRETGAIYRIAPNGNETRICTTGISLDPYFTTAGNRLVWTEVTWDHRYPSINYSDVIIYHSDISRKTYLTRKQRYFSPCLSSDGSRVVVAEVDSTGYCRLKILDSVTGQVIVTLPNPENLFFTYPKWDTDGSGIISSARTTAGGMLIVRQDLSSGAYTRLSDEYIQVIGEVAVTPGAVLFTAGFNGTNNIYSLSRSDRSISQLTESRFGAYFPAVSPDRKRLAYSDFTNRGYALVSAPLDSLLWKHVNPFHLDGAELFDRRFFQTEGGNILDRIPDRKMVVTPYRSWQHPLKIHSWMLSPGFYSAGINLISDDILSNLQLEGGINYYYYDAAAGFNAGIRYGGLYPILSGGISRVLRHPDITDFLKSRKIHGATSLDNKLSLQASVPLNFSKGEFYRQAEINLGYEFISVKDLSDALPGARQSYSVSAVSGLARWSLIRKTAYQNITTPLGLRLELNGNLSVGSTKASQFQAIGDFALRGLFPNHNFVLSAGWKYEAQSNPYHFMDLFLYPRGFTIPGYDWMFTCQGSYHFPLLYPDLGFGGIFYCSRIRASLFADYGYASIPAGSNIISNGILASAGSELIFDTRWFNLAEIPLGIRFSLLLTRDFEEPGRKARIEFVIPVIRL